MAPVLDNLPHHVRFDPDAAFEAFLASVPSKWVVYCFCDAAGAPVQLLCVRNLRASLKRRLGGDETIGLSKRVNYRELVRSIYWRRVDSAFEADWQYYEAAREVFPQTYQGMVGFRPAWFIHVNPATNFPRYVKTIDLSRSGLLAGPIEDKHAAARLIQLLEDAFDLCRYYHILIEAPRALACAYKQMHKCPAPCDGSISMEQYRLMIDWSCRTLIDPAPMLREQQARMTSAAAELRFEVAGKIKAYIQELSQLGKGAFRHVRKLSDFVYLSFQHGPRKGTAKVFLILPGEIREILGLIGEQPPAGTILREALSAAAEFGARHVDSTGAERVGIVSHHLFTARAKHGAFVPLIIADEPTILRACRDLRKQDVPQEVEGEGVVKELQSMGEPAPQESVAQSSSEGDASGDDFD